jgi:hypothetical protein
LLKLVVSGEQTAIAGRRMAGPSLDSDQSTSTH